MGHHQMYSGSHGWRARGTKDRTAFEEIPESSKSDETISLYFRESQKMEPEISVCESNIVEVYRAIDTTVMFIAALFTKPKGEYSPNVQSQSN